MMNYHTPALLKPTGSWWGIITAVWALCIYLQVNFILPKLVSPDQFLYLYQPVLWSSLAILAWLGWRYGLASRPKLGMSSAIMATLLAICQIAALALAGLFLGFGYSPYSHQLNAVLSNILYLATLLLGMEMMRAYLVTRFKESHPWLCFILVSVFLSVLRIAPATFGQFNTLPSAIQFMGERLLPTLTQSLLATLLAMLGGPIASISYLGILQLFEWLSPILPNLGWFVTALIGTLIPAYGMVIVYNHFIAEPEERDESEVRKDGSLTSWAWVAVFTVIMVGFSTGLFGINPSLIGSGSMTPKFMVGDIVAARELPIETIKVGDVIAFKQDGVTIVHRVIEIQSDAGHITFITKGDANASPDSPVLSENYKGKVVFTIPKIGWVSIFVRNFLVKIL